MSKEQLNSYERQFESTVQRAKDTKEALTGKGQVLTGFRSTAPVSFESLTDLPRLHQAFWDKGTTDVNNDTRRVIMRPNSTFAASAKSTSTLHYDTNHYSGTVC